MKIIKLQVGALGTNCYILYCTQTRETAIIDPGGSAQDIIEIINREKLSVKLIINTHGHADHITANDQVRDDTGASLVIHEEDADMLTSSQRNLSMFIGGRHSLKPADRLLKDGDIIELGELRLKVLHTPGHTPGGICLLVQDVLFSGDTLFCESIGRTDFPGGSYIELINSIKEKLLPLDDHIKVLPGHGPDTTIGWERKTNPFIQ